MDVHNDVLPLLDGWLNTQAFSDDYAVNGLQVEGNRSIRRLVSGVTASLAMIEAAIAAKADALLVHHGVFWRSDPHALVGMQAKRVAALMREGIHLLAYHLPLDAHDTYGNNVQLAHRLGLDIISPLGDQWGLGLIGSSTEMMSPSSCKAHIQQILGREPLHIAGPQKNLKRIAWSSGAAQDDIVVAAAKGCDAFLSGEVSERTYHQAKELGLHYFACGHHATERYGVEALGEACAKALGIEHQMIDIDNPV